MTAWGLIGQQYPGNLRIYPFIVPKSSFSVLKDMLVPRGTNITHARTTRHSMGVAYRCPCENLWERVRRVPYSMESHDPLLCACTCSHYLFGGASGKSLPEMSVVTVAVGEPGRVREMAACESHLS